MSLLVDFLFSLNNNTCHGVVVKDGIYKILRFELFDDCVFGIGIHVVSILVIMNLCR